METNVRRLEAARAFARANRLNRHNGAAARIGILSAGKPYYDLMQALRDLDVRDGIRIGKVGMPFPLEPEFVLGFRQRTRNHPGDRGEAQLPGIAASRDTV